MVLPRGKAAGIRGSKTKVRTSRTAGADTIKTKSKSKSALEANPPKFGGSQGRHVLERGEGKNSGTKTIFRRDVASRLISSGASGKGRIYHWDGEDVTTT